MKCVVIICMVNENILQYSDLLKGTSLSEIKKLNRLFKINRHTQIE
jgi:hypothetical protein